MDINAAYREVGTYRGAADICGTTPKTVKRIVEAAEQTGQPDRVVHNYDSVRDLVAERVAKTQGRITAKRLLPIAAAAGYTGSARNFRRLVAEAKAGLACRSSPGPPTRRVGTGGRVGVRLG